MKHQLKILIPWLPPEIMVKIISYLPAKSIIRCTLVCKLWGTLISNPFLAKNDPKYFLLHHPNSATFSILDHDRDRRVSEDQIIMLKPSFPVLEQSNKDITILGSCNGLVCFLKEKNIHLYNPIIGDHITFPRPILSSKRYDAIDARYSFGFCALTGTYKLFRCVFNCRRPMFEVEIYTLGSEGRWRHIGDAPRDMWNIVPDQYPICTGGVVHWLIEHRTISILTFNLATEKFGEASPPPLGSGERMYRLGYMDECLIATTGHHPCVDSTMRIWMRKESCWSKKWVVLDPILWNSNCWDIKSMVPIAVSSNGHILIADSKSKRVYSYDPWDRTRGSAFTVVISEISHVIPFDATLVSPRDLMVRS